MKVIIQNHDTQLYTKAGGGWTAKATEAEDYVYGIHATAVARSLGLENFCIFLFFPELDYLVAAGKSTSDSSGESSLVAHAPVRY